MFAVFVWSRATLTSCLCSCTIEFLESFLFFSKRNRTITNIKKRQSLPFLNSQTNKKTQSSLARIHFLSSTGLCLCAWGLEALSLVLKSSEGLIGAAAPRVTRLDPVFNWFCCSVVVWEAHKRITALCSGTSRPARPEAESLVTSESVAEYMVLKTKSDFRDYDLLMLELFFFAMDLMSLGASGH